VNSFLIKLPFLGVKRKPELNGRFRGALVFFAIFLISTFFASAPLWAQSAPSETQEAAPESSAAAPAVQTQKQEAQTPAETSKEPEASPAAVSSETELTTPPEATPAPPPPPVVPRGKKSVFVIKTARDDQYDKPVFYDSMENLLPTMDLEYDLSLEGGKSFRIGDVVISPQTFFVALLPVGKFHSRMTQVVGRDDARKMALVLRWPQPLWAEGTLEVISRTGTVLWKESINEAKKKAWSESLADWQRGLIAAGVKTKFPDTSVFGTDYGVLDPEQKGFRPRDESFRFCLSQARGRSRSSLCSQRYVLRRGKTLTLAKVKTVVTPRVLLGGEAAPLTLTKPVPKDAPTSLYADLANGESYEFVSLPNKLNLMDVSSGKTPDQLRVVGFGTRPTVPSTILNPDSYSNITKAIGFESTIGDMRKFWQISISAEDPKIYLPGVAGGVFAQRLDVSEVPRANARPYLDARTPKGTYIDGMKVYGQRVANSKIGSTENEIEIHEDDPTKFTWFFKATERGQLNRSYLNLEYEGQQYKAFYEIYKGFPRELSLRLSGLLAASGSMVFLGEVAYNHWFEDVFGWTNYTLARQRWGLSAKYFRSFTQLYAGKVRVPPTGTPYTIVDSYTDLVVANVDLKYRLSPGLWNRDETVGVMLDYQKLQFASMEAPMIGFGAFWARSMPKVFDDIFNIVPLMRHPKWVDMEFIYYPLSMSPTIVLQTNFALNFHGKVMWTKHWFGEAGFGLKRYAMSNGVQAAALNTFYGTVGLGLSF
jgi:hypothetical protein